MKRITFHPVIAVHGLLVMVDATITPGRPAPWCDNPNHPAYSDPGEPLEVEYDRVILTDWPYQDITPLFAEFEDSNKWLTDQIVLAWQRVGRVREPVEVGAYSGGPDGPVAESCEGYKIREGEQ